MTNILINTTEVKNLTLEGQTLSCQLMYNLSNSIQNKTIVCFYHKNKNIFGRFFVDTEKFSITFQGNFTTKEQINFLKSKVNSKKNKSLICFSYSPQYKIDCTIYSFENVYFSEFKDYEVYYEGKYYLSNLDYIRQTNQFLFYCANKENIT